MMIRQTHDNEISGSFGQYSIQIRSCSVDESSSMRHTLVRLLLRERVRDRVNDLGDLRCARGD